LDNQHLCTGDKLLKAAAELIAEKGFKAVTTREIACAAGVSEMTLFRHFGTKQAILERVIDCFYNAQPLQELFAQQLAWDLRTDLARISRTYQLHMNRNRKVLQILIREWNNAPEQSAAVQHPKMLKALLVDYFTRMQEQGKMIPCSAESQAMLFLWMNYGAFVSRLFSDGAVTVVNEEEFICDSVELFVRGLAP